MEQEKRTLYAFDKDDRLAAMVDDVELLPALEVIKIEKAQHMIGRHIDISKKGRAVCSYCRLDLGERPGVPAGLLSHGFCEFHKKEMLKEIAWALKTT